MAGNLLRGDSMSTLTGTTGNAVLDMRLSLLTGQELEKLADYARFLIWLRDDKCRKSQREGE